MSLTKNSTLLARPLPMIYIGLCIFSRMRTLGNTPFLFSERSSGRTNPVFEKEITTKEAKAFRMFDW